MLTPGRHQLGSMYPEAILLLWKPQTSTGEERMGFGKYLEICATLSCIICAKYVLHYLMTISKKGIKKN